MSEHISGEGDDQIFYPEDEEEMQALDRKEKERVPGIFLEILVVSRSGEVAPNIKHYVGPFKSEGDRSAFVSYWQDEVREGRLKNNLKFISVEDMPGGWAPMDPKHFGNLIKE